MQEWLGEQHETEQALSEIRDTLFDDCDRNLAHGPIAIIIPQHFFFGLEPMHDERPRVNRRLWNKTIRGWDTKETREEGRQTEHREVVMKPSRLAERKLRSLRDQ